MQVRVRPLATLVQEIKNRIALNLMPYNSARALQLLRLGSGLQNATFRDGQEEAIRHIVEGRGRLLVVQRTGWGKSFVYFIAAKLLREQGQGPTLLISPLLALMRNQLLAAQRMGVRADTINSENPDQWDSVERAIKNDELDILLISPERLANERFRAQVLSRAAARIALLVIDEAHCISDWGRALSRKQWRIAHSKLEMSMVLSLLLMNCYLRAQSCWLMIWWIHVGH